jgi:hypothetical protein
MVLVHLVTHEQHDCTVHVFVHLRYVTLTRDQLTRHSSETCEKDEV